MRWDYNKEEMIFNSGRREYANCCLIGLGPGTYISTGYDDSFHPSDLNRIEELEIADFMIELWSKYRKDLINKKFKSKQNS